MGKLANIKIYDYYGIKWDGQIIYDIDNWAEGVLKQNCYLQNDNNLVLGTYIPNQEINLLILSDEIHLFHSNNIKYNPTGELWLLTENKREYKGFFNIELNNVEQTLSYNTNQGNINEEKKELLKRITKYKNSLSNYQNEEFKKELSKIILHKYDKHSNKKLTKNP